VSARDNGQGGGSEFHWPAAPPLVEGEGLPPQPPRRRIKVLHITTRFWGGAGANVLLSAEGMDTDRYDVWVAAAADGPLFPPARAAGLRTVELPRMREVIAPLDDLATLLLLVRIMRRERFAIVHTHCAKAGLLGRIAARLAGIPIIVHTVHAFSFHPFMSPLRRWSYRFLERRVRRLAHQTFAVSPTVAREAVEERVASPGTVSVVPSAVELSEIPSERDGSVRRELGLPDDVPVVGTIGRIVSQKAPLDFVRMAARIAAVRPETRFVMVGDGSFEEAPLEEETKAEARKLGVDISFTGFRDDAPRIATAFDVFVITSLYEGLGRALTEALASGRPVVATAVNGVPDLIEPGASGLLSPPGEVETLATSVLWMIEHPDQAERMGRAGRRRVVGHFEPSVMCSVLDRSYRRLLGIPPSTEGAAVSSAAEEIGNGNGRENPRRPTIADSPTASDGIWEETGAVPGR
jgi:glycosyltransferase involved in cell wall biosynthesis